MVKTVGCATDVRKIEEFKIEAKELLRELSGSSNLLFSSGKDDLADAVIQSLSNSSIRTVGPEPVSDRIYDFIGFGKIGEELFRHLVVSRLAFPLSKLKTVEYLYRYQGVALNIDRVYRFLDKLNDRLKPLIENISFEHVKKRLGGSVSVVFYDMTARYFEASDGDDLRKTGLKTGSINVRK